MSGYAIMPYDDYKSACDAIREYSGKSDVIKSGDMAAEITAIGSGGGNNRGACGEVVCGANETEVRTLSVTGLGFKPKEIYLFLFGEAPKSVECTTQYIWKESTGGSGYYKYDSDAWRLRSADDFITVAPNDDGFTLSANASTYNEYYFYGTYVWAAF